MSSMDLKTKLTESMKDAMKTGDTVRKNTVRMALAAIKQVEVDKRTSLDRPGLCQRSRDRRAGNLPAQSHERG
jgi:uncharacterized protein YqeY